MIARGFKTRRDIRKWNQLACATRRREPPAGIDLQWRAYLSEVMIGTVLANGRNEGWIYCETFDGRPFLIAPQDSGIMRWEQAMQFAASHNASLPNRDELYAMHQERNVGALRNSFNVAGTYPGSWYWAGVKKGSRSAWCLKFSDGLEGNFMTSSRASVRCVRPLTMG